jgi:hypothetical protein
MKISMKTPIRTAAMVLILSACNLYNPYDGNLPVPETPPSSDTGVPAPSPPPVIAIGDCKEDATISQCLALKFIAYRSGSQDPTLEKIEADALVGGMNRVWKPCGIGFTLEWFEIVDPTAYRLAYSPDWRTESQRIRETFADPERFLIVAVGPWNISTIAVTQMPGTGPYGVLVEEDFATNELTVGHELGHYMGLYHYRNTTNLMNPYIGSDTEALTPSQCEIARDTNVRFWTPMQRL